MGIVDSFRELLVPDTEPGIVHECANCGEQFDKVHHDCPNFGSTEIIEQEGVDFQP
jgi:predicted RNA-binding Zn-ribbon protein involved in translation (DUF1610 family)